MKRKFNMSIAIVVVIAIAVLVYDKNMSIIDQRITCRNMMYACGDCYPQYKIVSTETDDSKELINADILLEFKDESIEAQFENEISSCVICYEFGFTGDFEYSIWNRQYTMNVEDYQLFLDEECCYN